MATETLTTSAENTTQAPASQSTEQAATVADSASQKTAAEPSASQTTEQTTETAKPAEQAKPEGAPEAYDFKHIDGVEVNAEVIGAFSEVAKELNLTQDAAQKVLDKMAPAIAAKQLEQIEAANKKWTDDSRADKEFGGDKLDESLAIAKKALDAFGTPELHTLLNDSGFGNHPDVIRFMVRVGKAISEDRFVAGGNSSGSTAPTVAQRMYPGMNP